MKFHARYAPVAVTQSPDDVISGWVFETPELYVAPMGPESYRIMVSRVPLDCRHTPAEGTEGFVYAPTLRLLHEVMLQAVSEWRLAAVREVGTHWAQLRTKPGMTDRLFPARLAEARTSEHGRRLKPAALRLQRDSTTSNNYCNPRCDVRRGLMNCINVGGQSKINPRRACAARVTVLGRAGRPDGVTCLT